MVLTTRSRRSRFFGLVAIPAIAAIGACGGDIGPRVRALPAAYDMIEFLDQPLPAVYGRRLAGGDTVIECVDTLRAASLIIESSRRAYRHWAGDTKCTDDRTPETFVVAGYGDVVRFGDTTVIAWPTEAEPIVDTMFLDGIRLVREYHVQQTTEHGSGPVDTLRIVYQLRN